MAYAIKSFGAFSQQFANCWRTLVLCRIYTTGGMRTVGSTILIVVGLAAQVHAQMSEDIVYVRQTIDSDYVTNVPNLPISQAGLTSVPTKRAEVMNRDTISGIVSRNYGVGVSNAPSAYNEIQSFIMATNNIDNPDLIEEGQLLEIPDLPRIALQEPNPSNRYNSIPKMIVQCELTASGGASIVRTSLCDALDPIANQVQRPAGVKTASYVFEQFRKGARNVVQIKAVTSDQAKILLQDNSYQVDSAVVDIKFAQTSGTNNHSYQFIQNNRQLWIRSLLAAGPVKYPILIVLDDAWPDNEAFRESKDFFVKAIRTIRANKKMGPPNFSDAMLKATTTTFVAPNNQHGITHSSKIRDAIEPLKKLEPPSGRVAVIYLPLSRVQSFASEILENLVAINLLSKTLKTNLDDPLDPVPADLQESTFAQAHTYVGRTSNILGAVVKSDQAVIEAVLNFARLYATYPRQPIFLNMSWTVPNLQYQVVVPTDAYGLNIVAAGNEGDGTSRTVLDLRRQFPYRSMDPGDMLAVMNVNSNGLPICDSSLLPMRPDVLGVSFDGAYSNADCGGTSFAAPRVAWLIAAREALIPVTQEQKQWQWKADLKEELKNMRTRRAENYNKMRFNVQKFFNKINMK